jgi:hypothetical protein
MSYIYYEANGSEGWSVTVHPAAKGRLVGVPVLKHAGR